MNNPLINSVLFLFTYLSPLALGQDSGENSLDDKNTKGRKAWIVATSLPDDVQSPIKVLAGGDVSEVRISKRSVGKPIKVSKDGLVQVVKPILNAEGEESYEVHASALVPEGVHKALIILTPDPNLSAPLKFTARVIDLGEFRGGNSLFINHTKVDIAVVLGNQKALLNSGEIKIMDVGDFKGTKNVTVSYHYRIPKQEKWNLISASTVALRSSYREILIFSVDTKLRQIDYHGITFFDGKF